MTARRRCSSDSQSKRYCDTCDSDSDNSRKDNSGSQDVVEDIPEVGLDNQAAAPSRDSSVGHQVVQDTVDSWLVRALAFCCALDTVDIPGPVVDFLDSSKDKAGTRCSCHLC